MVTQSTHRAGFVRRTLAPLMGGLALATSGQAIAAPVDLSSWISDGTNTWNVAPDNNSVQQTENGRPTFFHNNTNSQGTALGGSITVDTSSDNDFIGFVLGYTQGDTTADDMTAVDYILIDWKQGSQGGWDEGMAISRVTGPIDTAFNATNSDAWDHVGNVEFIERAATLGDTGWVDRTTYNFDIEFTSSRIRVAVDGIEQFDVTGTFADGAFGFYNYSQADVTYAGITEDVLPPDPVPVPAAALLFAPVVGGIVMRRRRTSR
ncbi:MAG: PEP-CTERM sorting domain-containing protein [Pseudomonadota bacterium]